MPNAVAARTARVPPPTLHPGLITEAADTPNRTAGTMPVARAVVLTRAATTKIQKRTISTVNTNFEDLSTKDEKSPIAVPARLPRSFGARAN